MSLAEHAPKRTPRVCQYARALDRLDTADAATLRDWVSTGMSSIAIARALQENGTPYVSDSVIGAHRRGSCVCTR